MNNFDREPLKIEQVPRSSTEPYRRRFSAYRGYRRLRQTKALRSRTDPLHAFKHSGGPLQTLLDIPKPIVLRVRPYSEGVITDNFVGFCDTGIETVIKSLNRKS